MERSSSSIWKRGWKQVLFVQSICVLIQLSGMICRGEEGPQTAFFQWSPVRSATFAIYTESEVDRQLDTTYLLYEMKYDRSEQTVRLKEFQAPIPHDAFSVRQTNIRTSTDSVQSAPKGINRGGELAACGEMYRHGHPLAYWTDTWWKRHWIVFPVFQNKGQTIALGDTWVSETWPFIQDASLGYDKIMRGTVKVKDLPPTSIKSHWRAWEKKNGFPCAVIDFSFQAKSDPKLVEGKEASEYKLSGTSYFSVELGLPVATEIKASGFVVNGAGERKKITLLRREVLVTHEAKKEEDRDIKK